MNCFKCATPLPDGAKFCFTCGSDVSGEHPHDHDKTIAVEPDPEIMTRLQADVGTEYVIEREVGRGGMAIVYLGHDASLGRKVAVKLLPPELMFGAGSSVIERFKREARTSATLDHPNIIPVYRVSQGQKLFWYVMKFLEGEALDTIIEREGQLEVERTVDIVRQTADALDYAHQHQVIHRDIKPANLMIDKKGRVTVTDFGIARALDAKTLTATGSMIGTPYFMSPEQCSGKRVGPASDQYSLAVMVYLMLGGHLPFIGDSVVDIIRKHVMDPVPPLGVLRPQLPAPLVAAVERGLAKQPDQRFANCAEFAKALAQAAQGVDVTAAPPSKPGASGIRISKTALVSPVPGVLRTAKGTAKSRKALIVGVVVAGVLVAFAIGAFIALGRQGAPQPGADGSATQGQQATPAGQPTQLAAGDSTGAAGAPSTAAAAPPASPASRPARTTNPRGSSKRQPAPNRRAANTPPVQTQKAVPTPSQPSAPGPSAPAAAPGAAPATGSAFITIGSTPMSAMTINGRPAPQNPVSNLEVPSGTVRVHFQVTDTSGVWGNDATYTLAPGEHKTVGRVRLVRHP